MVCLLRITSQQGFVHMPAPCSGARPSLQITPLILPCLSGAKDQWFPSPLMCFPYVSHMFPTRLICVHSPATPMNRQQFPYTFPAMDRRPIGRRLNTCRPPRSGRRVVPPIGGTVYGGTVGGRGRALSGPCKGRLGASWLRPADRQAGVVPAMAGTVLAGHGI